MVGGLEDGGQGEQVQGTGTENEWGAMDFLRRDGTQEWFKVVQMVWPEWCKNLGGSAARSREQGAVEALGGGDSTKASQSKRGGEPHSLRT
jgi:hypothetical protein